MFTGLVETIGILRRRSQRNRSARAAIETSLGRREALVLGESVNVDGACLTVDRILPEGFEADLSDETLSRTTLGALRLGARVHLERATPLGGRMGGHTVLGHVDGIARVTARTSVGDAICLEIQAPGDLARFVAAKGSIAVNGVSLTLNSVKDERGVVFTVMLVPHTLARTNLGESAPGNAVNIEVDVLARYVARELEVGGAEQRPPPSRAGEEHHVADDERLLEKLRAGGWT